MNIFFQSATALDHLFVVVQLLSYVQLFAIPWTAALQASLFFTVSQSLLKFMSVESVMLSNHLILCCPLLLLPSIFPSICFFFFFSLSRLFPSGGQSIEASASVLPVNIQDWFPLGLTGLISLLSKGLFNSLLQHYWQTAKRHIMPYESSVGSQFFVVSGSRGSLYKRVTWDEYDQVLTGMWTENLAWVPWTVQIQSWAEKFLEIKLMVLFLLV